MSVLLYKTDPPDDKKKKNFTYEDLEKMSTEELKQYGIDNGILKPYSKSNGDGYTVDAANLPEVGEQYSLPFEIERKWVRDWYDSDASRERMLKLEKKYGGQEDILSHKAKLTEPSTWFNNDEDQAEKYIDDALKNIDTVKYKVNPFKDRGLPIYTGSYAYYSRPRHYIYTSDIRTPKEDIPHETAHAAGLARLNPQKKAIHDIYTKNKETESRWGYMGSNEEINARIMEIRRQIGAKPGEIFTKEELKRRLKKNHVRDTLLDTYKSQTIVDWLNTLVSNDTKKSNATQVARQGGILYKKSK